MGAVAVDDREAGDRGLRTDSGYDWGFHLRLKKASHPADYP